MAEKLYRFEETTMFKKILTAIDPVEPENDVFDRALLLAQTMRAKLKLLSVLTADINSVIATPEYSMAGPSYGLNDWNLFEESYQTYKKENVKMLHRLRERSRERGVNANFEQVMGSPGKAICDLAKSWEADLIVVGSHQRKGLSEMFLRQC
ncbi:MAG: universal stress protein [Bacteroidota bacterium]